MGMASLGLGCMLASQELEGAGGNRSYTNPLSPRAPHFAPKAKRVIHLFMNGGPSHVDTFDPKPMLDKLHGKKLPIENLRTERKTGAAFRSPFKFRRWGRSGIEVSELFPNVAESIDEIAVIRSMHADVPNHEPSLLLLNCGDARQVRPSMGSWITYGLGTENQNLPGFIAMCPGGYPIQESQNWQSGFLPGIFQGTHIDTKHTRVDKLIEHIRNPDLTLPKQRQQLDLLKKLNLKHKQKRQAEGELEARINTFELAYRMQTAAPEVQDISGESEATRKLYGLDKGNTKNFGRQCLMARRFAEAGVRFIQCTHSYKWDQHGNLRKDHAKNAAEVDKPIAGLLQDLKQRGLLDETIVHWTTEFGRMPCGQGSLGRDHNPFGFTNWLAGGGIKGGVSYGATDEWSWRAVDKPTDNYDVHATVLHALGIDHKRLTHRTDGIDRRLTDVHGHVIKDLIA